MTPIRLLHVGARGRGRWPVDLAAADPRFESVALVGRDPQLLGEQLAAAGLGPSAAFGDLHSALAAVDCDAVVVATPVELHGRDLRVAFEAGKHVLVEKCLTNQWLEAVELVEAADAAGVKLLVAQNYRFTPEWRTATAAVAGGAYGSVGVVNMTVHKYRPAPRQQDYPLAAFWDQGCHHVDVLQAMFGPVVEATARTYTAPWSRYRDDAAVLTLARFESGATWVYDLSNVARRFYVACAMHTELGALFSDAGRWEFHRGAASDDDAFGWNDEPVPVAPVAGPATGEHGVLDAFYAAVADGKATVIDGRANLETLRTCEMVRRSVVLDRTVSRSEVT